MRTLGWLLLMAVLMVGIGTAGRAAPLQQSPQTLHLPAILSDSGIATYPRLTNLTYRANGASTTPVADGAGNTVAFLSEATNLVPDDTNGVVDGFVWQRATGQIQRISVASDGTEANKATTGLVLSEDGRYLLFFTEASNLAAGDTNGLTDLYRHDLQTALTEWVSVGLNGAAPDGVTTSADVSADGRWVVFSSRARNITTVPLPADCPEAPCETLYRRDMQTGTTETWFVNEADVAVAPLRNPSLSADGQQVAYEQIVQIGSMQTEFGMVPVYGPYLYWYQNDSQPPLLVAESEYFEVLGRGESLLPYDVDDRYSHPMLDADGQSLTYRQDYKSSSQYGLFLADALLHDSVVAEPQTVGRFGRFWRMPPQAVDLSVRATAISSGGWSVMSAYDLRDVIENDYEFDATPEIADDTNAKRDIYLMDRAQSVYRRISNAPDGLLSNGDSDAPFITAQGRVVVFQSEATNLSENDTNGVTDIFVWETVR